MIAAVETDAWSRLVDEDFAASFLSQVERGSDIWQVFASDDDYDAWLSEHLAEPGGAGPIAAAEGAQIDAEIQAELRRLRVREEAARLHRAMSSTTLGRVLDWAELDDFAARPDLVPGLLGVGTTGLLVSKRNIGKSLLAFLLAACVATGTPFLGRSVEQGRVVIVLGEGVRGLKKRMLAIASAYELDIRQIMTNVRVVADGVNFSNDASLASVRSVVTEFQPSLIILDTFASLAGITEENDQAAQQRFLNDILLLGGDATKLILHHPNAESEDTTAPKSRGGSALPSGVDTVMTLWYDRTRSDPKMPGAQFLALSTEDEHAGKQKESERETIRGLYLAENPEGVYMAHAPATLSAAERWVCDNLEIGVEMTIAQIIEASMAPRSTVQRHLGRAAAYVEKLPGESGGAATYVRTR